MNALTFDFGTAMMHFRKTGGPKGFLLRFMLVYGLLGLVVQAISMYFMGPIYAASFNPDLANDPAAMEAVMIENMGRMMLGYLVIFVAGIFLWMVFEAASQRRYMRGEGFRLQLGADEWRLLLIGLIWVGLFIGLYIGMAITVAIPLVLGAVGGESAALIGGVLMLVAFIGYAVFALWLCAKLSPAAALTIRDEKIQFSEAWRVTKGKAWTIVGAWFVLMLIIGFVFAILYMILIGIFVAAMMPSLQQGGFDDPSEMMRVMMSPGVLVPGLIIAFIYMALNAAMMHIFGGPAALAAKTDPNWVDNKALDQTFV